MQTREAHIHARLSPFLDRALTSSDVQVLPAILDPRHFREFLPPLLSAPADGIFLAAIADQTLADLAPELIFSMVLQP